MSFWTVTSGRVDQKPQACLKKNFPRTKFRYSNVQIFQLEPQNIISWQPKSFLFLGNNIHRVTRFKTVSRGKPSQTVGTCNGVCESLVATERIVSAVGDNASTTSKRNFSLVIPADAYLLVSTPVNASDFICHK